MPSGAQQTTTFLHPKNLQHFAKNKYLRYKVLCLHVQLQLSIMSDTMTKDTFTKFSRQLQPIEVDWHHGGNSDDKLTFFPNGTFQGKKYAGGRLNEWVICHGGINRNGGYKLCIGMVGIKQWIEEKNRDPKLRPVSYYKEFDLSLSLYDK